MAVDVVVAILVTLGIVFFLLFVAWYVCVWKVGKLFRPDDEEEYQPLVASYQHQLPSARTSDSSNASTIVTIDRTRTSSLSKPPKGIIRKLPSRQVSRLSFTSGDTFLGIDIGTCFTRFAVVQDGEGNLKTLKKEFYT